MPKKKSKEKKNTSTDFCSVYLPFLIPHGKLISLLDYNMLFYTNHYIVTIQKKIVENNSTQIQCTSTTRIYSQINIHTYEKKIVHGYKNVELELNSWFQIHQTFFGLKNVGPKNEPKNKRVHYPTPSPRTK